MAQPIRISEIAHTIEEGQIVEASRKAMSTVERALGAPFGEPVWLLSNGFATFGKLTVVDTTSGASSVSLPQANLADVGAAVTVKAWGSVNVTIRPSGTDTIDNAASVLISAGGSAMIVVAAAGIWVVV